MPPSDASKARDELRESEPGKRSGGTGAPIDEDDQGAALLKDLTVGTIVDGKYRIDEVLGRGAMGVVVAATHLQLGERVALKFLRYRSKGVNDDFQSRFKREARVSARLKNEHITRVIDVGVWRDHVPYMVMDYLNGTDLRQALKREGPLQVAQAIDYVVQVCVGISEAHAAGIVHRDLKPSNLFITRRPDGSDLVKILDFGISKWSAEEAEIEELTQTGVVLGSPKYMAPEQLFGSNEVDTRADVWSIGAILYELLTGRPPFDLPTFTKICAELSTDRPPPRPSEKRPEITPELEAVILKCFMRDPNTRIQNVAELAGDLLDAVEAPFAEPMRQKIASTLASKGGRESLGLSGSGGLSPLGSGTYASVTGSTSGKRAVATPASTSGAARAVEEAGGSSSRSRLALGIVAGLLAAGIVAYVALGARAPAPSAATAPPSAPAVSVPVVATGAPSAAAAPSASAAASAAPSATDSAAAASAASAATSPARPGHHGGWRPPPPAPAPHPVATATATATPTATQPVATAAATATATATGPKPDPLGDRQ
ncbi:MAG TPA: serine/threonine-protein kinase [Polyangiaceae bacterium]